MGDKMNPKKIWQLEGQDKTPKKPLWKLEEQEWWQVYSASVKAGEIQTVRMSQMEQLAAQNALKAQESGTEQIVPDTLNAGSYVCSCSGSAAGSGSYISSGSGSGSGVIGYGLNLI